MGRLINHSAHPNCKIEIIWNAGVPLALVIAVEDIGAGEQILIDYQQTFWHHFNEKKAAKARGQKPDRISLWNYNDEDAMVTRVSVARVRASVRATASSSHKCRRVDCSSRKTTRIWLR